eukprot:6475158-Amphidinium_carterae.1
MSEHLIGMQPNWTGLAGAFGAIGGGGGGGVADWVVGAVDSAAFCPFCRACQGANAKKLHLERATLETTSTLLDGVQRIQAALIAASNVQMMQCEWKEVHQDVQMAKAECNQKLEGLRGVHAMQIGRAMHSKASS